MTASRFGLPAILPATAAAGGWAVCQLVRWISISPLRTVPTHNVSGYRGNAARNGCVRTWRIQSYRTPSQVTPTDGSVMSRVWHGGVWHYIVTCLSQDAPCIWQVAGVNFSPSLLERNKPLRRNMYKISKWLNLCYKWDILRAAVLQ